MKNKVILGLLNTDERQGDSMKIDFVNEIKKNQKIVVLDESGEYDSMKKYLAKNVTIIKRKNEISKLHADMED